MMITKAPSWGTTRTSSARHYNASDTEMKEGQKKRALPEDFKEKYLELKSARKLAAHYGASQHKIAKWVKEIGETDETDKQN
jgi:hypothetical protein